MAEIDLITDHFPISEEEIMRAIEAGQSEKYTLRSVGNGGNFRGYIITDSKYGVRIADYIYNHSRGTFELKMKPNYQEELEKARLEAKNVAKERKTAQKYKLFRKRVAVTLGVGALSVIMAFAGANAEKAMMNRELNDPTPVNPVIVNRSNLETCDYRLCVRYLDYSLGYLDSIINSPNTDPNAVVMLERHKEALRTGYANLAYAAAADIDDYKAMPGFENSVKDAEARVRRYTEEFEEQFLAIIAGGKSFAESPLNGAIVLDNEGKEIVYIPESVENYADGKVPEGSITKDGLLYVPLGDSARYDGVKAK